MFMADVVCIVLLAFAVLRAVRSPSEPTLGLFAYKDIVKDTPSRRRIGHDEEAEEVHDA